MRSSWLDHPGTVTMVAAVAGSIIMVVGQLFGALFPIWLGPDLSDFDLVCDPIYHNILFEFDLNSPHSIIATNELESSKNGISNVTISYPKGTTSICSYEGTSTIRVVSLHRIYNYDREIYLNVESSPGINVSLSNPIVRLGKPVDLHINVDLLSLLKSKHAEYGTRWSHKYPILIKGIGADGKERNCTVIIGIGPAGRNALNAALRF